MKTRHGMCLCKTRLIFTIGIVSTQGNTKEGMFTEGYTLVCGELLIEFSIHLLVFL